LDKNLFLKGEKTILQPVNNQDITDVYVGWLNDPEIVFYSNQRFITHTKETCLDYLNSFTNTENIYCSIKDIQNKKVRGSITAYIHQFHGTADMGLLIGDRTVWGKGFGFEAWSLLMAYLFEHLGIRKITAGTIKENIGMVNIMKRSGMHLEANRKKQEIVAGTPRDILYFAKFNDE